MIATILRVTGISRLWLYAAAAGAIVGGVLLILARARSAGRQAERIDSAMRTLKVKDAQIKAAAAAPRGRDAVVDRLRNAGL